MAFSDLLFDRFLTIFGSFKNARLKTVGVRIF